MYKERLEYNPAYLKVFKKINSPNLADKKKIKIRLSLNKLHTFTGLIINFQFNQTN